MEFSLTVLSYKLEVLLLFLFPSEDRIYTDSRRIKPNSRSSLLSEQLNPSKLLHLEDEKSRPFFIYHQSPNGLDYIFNFLFEMRIENCWELYEELLMILLIFQSLSLPIIQLEIFLKGIIIGQAADCLTSGFKSSKSFPHFTQFNLDY